MPRWSTKEQECIDTIRSRVSDLLETAPKFPEVVGDRKIVRFLRGHDYNLDKVTELYRKFLSWRKTQNVDEIRTNIVENGMDHPSKFPKGELILSLIPQLPMAPDALDNVGSPLCVEQYNFSPSVVLSKINLQDYIVFTTYCLEYRSIILDQMSEERERQYLASLSEKDRQEIDTPSTNLQPYGILVHTCVIRDLGGVGFEHLGSQGLEIIKTVVALASDNYPELMRKCFMINTPWVFNTAWYFVKGLLAARTLAKISVLGTSFKDELSKELSPANTPSLIGGPYIGYSKYVPYPFNKDYLCPHLAGVASAETSAATIPPSEVAEVESNSDPVQEDVPLVQPEVNECGKDMEPQSATPTETISSPSSHKAAVEQSSHNTQSSTDDVSDGIDINLISLQTSGF